jgi:two-component system CheB/CheR fusion protein
VGASAGGLHALQRFFSAVPAQPGLAFVIVQHLDPTHRSETAELLKKYSQMPVVQIGENQPVEVNRVYVIPPDRDLTIRGGILRLTKPAERRGMRLPIDLFLRSLADDQQERGIAIILSGSASDGSQGIRAVKAAGGLTLAQDPDTAEHDGMPRSAVATGVVDFVLPVEQLPAVLLRYARHPYVRQERSRSRVDETAGQLQSILALVRARTRHDFTSYKTGTISRRIERRMSLHHLPDIQAYLKFLQTHPAEVHELFNDLLISVTSFFREPQAWEYLEKSVIPRLIRARSHDSGLRAWVPGCATGEEAYSIAMLLLEQAHAADPRLNVQVFASDLDQAALQFARAGVYPASIAADVPPERLRRFFVKGEHTYQAAKQLRETVVFAAQNLIGDPPFSRIDLITCRNLLIYLAPEIQHKVISLFHFALREDGYLFLGNAESAGPQSDLFEPVSKRWRIYRRIGPVHPDRVQLPVRPTVGRLAHVAAVAAPVALPLQYKVLSLAQALILERHVPASALINANQEILYLFGPTERYLTQPTGLLTPDLLRWARQGIRSKLSAALRQARQKMKPVTMPVGAVEMGGESRLTRITVEPLPAPKEMQGLFLVVFEETPATSISTEPVPDEPAAAGQMEYELDIMAEQLRTTTAQFESPNAELQSANEEMLSMNEELQSTNEELETSKEELQSLNEELSTVNSQLESKIQELEITNDDLKNLLSSSNIATVFLDREFRIKRFTPAVTQLVNLLPTDLRRPISDFAQKFTDSRLIPDAERVLATLTPAEAEVRTEAGRWYLRRILPYRTENDRIEGVVVTFVDLTERRKTEEERARLAAIVESSGVAIIGETLEGTITAWNRGAEDLYGYTAKEAIGQSVEMLVPADRRSELANILRRVAAGEIVEQGETVRLHKDGRRLDVLLTVSPVYSSEGGDLIGASAIGRNISARKQAEEQIRRAKETLEAQVVDRTKQLMVANRKLRQEISDRRQAEHARMNLLQRMVTIQGDERRRISRELHDQIGQHVAALSLRLKAIEPAVADPAGFKACQEMLDQLGRELRDLALAVRPTALDELGLVPALSTYAEEWAKRNRVKLDFHDQGLTDLRLPPAIEEAVYRIGLEALTNVAKHARAKRVSLILERRADALQLIVEDDGEGFDVEAPQADGAGEHLGLLGIRERAALLEGKVTVESRPPSGGTTLFVRIPIPGGGADV